ncbi:ligase-associated DNA damage response endonuclease PdeM [Octadecabacter sp.]|nr:ligase-associated DNA damage response endonuclease PdeM [Octadecabacter sp.]
MSDYNFTFAGATLVARADGSLWWPDECLLCVSDLHLGKSERVARRGGALLPPYETQETLWRLKAAIDATTPATVICLGDSFDDLDAANAIEDDARTTIATLQAGRDWVWIEGNHDPGPVSFGGSHYADLERRAVIFQHIAETGDIRANGEISGHFHPKASLSGIAARACFLITNNRIILPAFGAYTGGLSIADPVFAPWIDEHSRAVLTGKSATPVPTKAILKRR